MDLQGLLQQARKIQEHMARMQEELGTKTVEASAGGGMVSVVANGRQELISITIAPEVVRAEDVGMLQDLVAAAVNEALRASKKLMQEQLGALTGGLRIPGITA